MFYKMLFVVIFTEGKNGLQEGILSLPLDIAFKIINAYLEDY